jgi:hypothetical protein
VTPRAASRSDAVRRFPAEPCRKHGRAPTKKGTHHGKHEEESWPTKSEPRTGPLVLEEAKKRETILTEVWADTAQELSEYAAWVKESAAPSKMTPAEATSKTIDFALRKERARGAGLQWHYDGLGKRITTGGHFPLDAGQLLARLGHVLDALQQAGGPYPLPFGRVSPIELDVESGRVSRPALQDSSHVVLPPIFIDDRFSASIGATGVPTEYGGGRLSAESKKV